IHGPNGTDSLRAKYADVITEETLQRIEVYERLNPNSHLWNPAVIVRAYLCSEQSKLILALLKEGIAFDALQKWRMCVAYAENMYELDMPLDGFERNPRPMTVAGTAVGPKEKEKRVHLPPELRTVKREEFVEKVRMGGLQEERAS